MESKKLLFIIGVGRSGTSLLQSMFASNSNFKPLAETSFLRRFAAKKKCEKLFRSSGREALVGLLETDTNLLRLNYSVEELLDSGIIDNYSNLDFKIYYDILNKNSTSKWVVDKDPRMIEHLNLLTHIDIGTQLIHIIRDPRDVLASKKKADWSKQGHVWKHIFANKVQFLMGTENGPKYFGINYQEVIYERLIATPDLELKLLCSNLGVPFESKMLDFGGAAKKIVAKDEVNWKKETFGPLLTSNTNKWKNELSLREIKLTELCCKQNFIKGGYEPAPLEGKLSVIDYLWIFSGFIVISVFTPIYMYFRK